MAYAWFGIIAACLAMYVTLDGYDLGIGTLLLLDTDNEPTEGLDAPTARVILERLRDLLPAATIVAAIHDKDLAAVTRHDVLRR